MALPLLSLLVAALLALAPCMLVEAQDCSGSIRIMDYFGVTQLTNPMNLHRDPIMDPATIPRWVNRLPNPLHPSFVYKPDNVTMGSNVDYYEIGMRQIQTQILPNVTGCPMTDVFAYGAVANASSYSYPGHTFVATKGRPVKVKYVHTLMPHTHLFPINRDYGCGINAPNCTPDVRTVAHLHGGHVDSDFDGFPDAWMASTGAKGTMYKETYTYPNDHSANTLWYHDHAMGITRLNVYAGLAGFYMVRTPREAVLQAQRLLPRYPYDLPLVIQDRTFRPNGSLYYPDILGMKGFNFGSVFVVNGKAWPLAFVERRKYRIRLLNGCNNRFLAMKFTSNATNPTTLPVWMIATDAGLLQYPINKTDSHIIFAPAERGEFIVDFSDAQVGEEFILTNIAASPYLGVNASNTLLNSTKHPMGEIVKFKVKLFKSQIRDSDSINSTTPLRNNNRHLPSDLSPYNPLQTNVTVRKFQITMTQMSVPDIGIPGKNQTIKHGLNLLGTPVTTPFGFMTPITETNITLGEPEVWEVYNAATSESHPIHIHQTKFFLLSRNKIMSVKKNGAFDHYAVNESSPLTIAPEEKGPKDTIQVGGGEVVRLLVKFDKPGLFVWHCHILEHEDFDMMRAFCVGGNCSTPYFGASV